MLIVVKDIPRKNEFRRKALRMGAIEEFLQSDYDCAEYSPEVGDNARRAYNGLLMAIRRQYAGRVAVSWRHGHVFLRRLSGAEDGQE